MSANIATQVTCPLVPDMELSGTIDAIPTGSSKVGGSIDMTITFSEPLPVDIVFTWGFDQTMYTTKYLNNSNGYPWPRTYSAYNDYCGGNTLTIPAGTVIVNASSNCSNAGAYYGYVSKVVIHNTNLNGYTIKLRPVRNNMTFEVR